MEFTWDARKDAANLRKHGVAFADAAEVFTDPMVRIEENSVVNGEQRWQAIGTARGILLLIVVHTVAGDLDNRIRIISARELTNHEKREYEHGN